MAPNFLPILKVSIHRFRYLSITFKFGTISGNKHPMTMKPSLHKFAFIFWAIGKFHYSKAIWQAFIELPFKGCSFGSFQVAFATFYPIFIKVSNISWTIVECIRPTFRWSFSNCKNLLKKWNNFPISITQYILLVVQWNMMVVNIHLLSFCLNFLVVWKLIYYLPF